jgi:hypothetical protein
VRSLVLQNLSVTLFVGVRSLIGSCVPVRLSRHRGGWGRATVSAGVSATRNAAGNASRVTAGSVEQELTEQRDRLVLLLGRERDQSWRPHANAAAVVVMGVFGCPLARAANVLAQIMGAGGRPCGGNSEKLPLHRKVILTPQMGHPTMKI